MHRIVSSAQSQTKTITFLALLTLSDLAHAESAQNIWASAKSHLSRNTGMVAQRIETKFSLPGDDAQTSGRYVTVISGTALSGEPRRVLQAITDEGQMGMKIAPLNFSIATSLANQPDQLFESVNGIQRLGDDHVDGKSWEILEVKSAMRTGNVPITAKVWISKEDGSISKLNATIKESILPGVKVVNFAVIYAPDSQGRSLPHIVTVDYPISILFHSGRVSFAHVISEWKSR